MPRKGFGEPGPSVVELVKVRSRLAHAFRQGRCQRFTLCASWRSSGGREPKIFEIPTVDGDPIEMVTCTSFMFLVTSPMFEQ